MNTTIYIGEQIVEMYSGYTQYELLLDCYWIGIGLVLLCNVIIHNNIKV